MVLSWCWLNHILCYLSKGFCSSDSSYSHPGIDKVTHQGNQAARDCSADGYSAASFKTIKRTFANTLQTIFDK